MQKKCSSDITGSKLKIWFALMQMAQNGWYERKSKKTVLNSTKVQKDNNGFFMNANHCYHFEPFSAPRPIFYQSECFFRSLSLSLPFQSIWIHFYKLNHILPFAAFFYEKNTFFWFWTILRSRLIYTFKCFFGVIFFCHFWTSLQLQLIFTIFTNATLFLAW